MTVPATFGTWLRQQREAHDLTRAECATLIGCSPDSLRKIEHDLRKPSKAMTTRILDVLDVPAVDRPPLFALARQIPLPPPATVFPPAPPLPAPRLQPLPQPLTPLIGRAHELAMLTHILAAPATRLLTLVGPPGAGKTRLALALGAMLHEEGSAVTWVPLSAVNDPTHILPTLLSILDITPGPTDPLDALISVLSRQPWVLIVDNLEHLLDGTPLLSYLLTQVNTLRIIATSREPLMLSGEQIREVRPLDLPPPDIRDIATLSLSPAVQLLLHQRTAVTGRTDLDPEDLPAVAGLCRILDGLPLALELAAMQLQYMSLPALYAQVTGMLPQLAYRWRDREPRQHSLWSAIASSVATLPPETQHLLYSTSVWRGGWTMESLKAIAGVDPAPVLTEQVYMLADKHLIIAVPDAPELRWTMLHVIREYAAHHLTDAAAVQARHARWYETFARAADGALRGPKQDDWLTRLEAEIHNLRNAMTWGLDNGAAALALSIAANLYLFWSSRGWYTEGRAWLSQALAAAVDAPPAERAKGWKVLGVLMMRQGAMAESLAAYTESLQLYQALGDHDGQAAVLNNIGLLYMDQGQLVLARQTYEQSISLIRASKSSDRWLLGIVVGNLGAITERQGEYAAAQQWAEESLRLRRQVGDNAGIALTLMNLGVLAQRQSDLVRAQRFYEESLAISAQLGNEHQMAMCLWNLGSTTRDLERYGEAEEHYAKALELFTRASNLQGQAQIYHGLSYLRMVQREHKAAVVAAEHARDLAITAGDQVLMQYIAIHHVALALDQRAIDEAWAELQALAPRLLLSANRDQILEAAELAALILQHEPTSAATATHLWHQSQVARRVWGIPMSVSAVRWAARHGSTALMAEVNQDITGEDTDAVLTTLAQLLANHA